MKGVVVKTPLDTVGNAVEDIRAGDAVAWKGGGSSGALTAVTDVPFGFKMALADIAPGAPVIMYGEPIGTASAAIRAGERVHIHNLIGGRAAQPE